MSPRFNPNPTEAQGGISNLPKGSYTFEIGETKAFDASKDTKESHGVQIQMTVISEGPHKGKKIYPRFWMSSVGGRNATKGFQLAALGFTGKQEEDWNNQFGGKDWGYDTDDKSVGSGWSELKGQLVCADLDITMQGEAEFQSYRWRPYSA